MYVIQNKSSARSIGPGSSDRVSSSGLESIPSKAASTSSREPESARRVSERFDIPLVRSYLGMQMDATAAVLAVWSIGVIKPFHIVITFALDPISSTQDGIFMSDLAPRKQEHDYTSDVDALFSELDGSASDLTPSVKVDKLLVVEKQCRNAADLSSTSRVLIKILEVLHPDWTAVNLQLSALSRKHGQLREAARRMVDRAMEWLPELKQSQDEENRMKLIETLREVTEGKVILKEFSGKGAHIYLYLRNTDLP